MDCCTQAKNSADTNDFYVANCKCGESWVKKDGVWTMVHSSSRRADDEIGAHPT